jgi:hypothetical protein
MLARIGNNPVATLLQAIAEQANCQNCKVRKNRIIGASGYRGVRDFMKKAAQKASPFIEL